MRGFKFHPNIQAFFPNDRMAYPLYEVIAEAGLPALFHTGHSGIGSGVPGGGGLRLKYSQPIYVDDVAADFPEMPIVLAHPSFPWQDEALSIAMHKPEVYIDLSGWSPKYFPPQLIQYTNTLLKHQVLFGSDYPMIKPERWLQGLRAARHRRRGAAARAQGECSSPARPQEEPMIEPGGPAPDFTLQDQDGNPVELSGLRGKWVVVYFYPKADTPGCTAQACGIRDHSGDYEAANAVVLGVSPDTVEDLRAFADKYGLAFTLLSDVGGEVASKYGVWVEKTYGKSTWWGNQRSSVLVDPEGNVARVFPKVKPAEHDELVLTALREAATA